ncbi:MAG: TIGR03545 family protein [Elusimicrobiales bacterium]|nr:TIGR03545 family protein [Elusimicrobiales bacterium]
MRWSYVAPRLTLLVLVWAFFFFAFDPLLKWGMIKGIEKAAKAKAEIAELETGFFPPRLRMAGVAVGDSAAEFSNVVEFSELSFAAEGKPLLEKKLVSDEASLKGLRFGTPRKTSAKLPFVKEDKEESKLAAAMSAEAKSFALDRVTDIKADFSADYKVEPDDLESVKLAKELEESYKTNYAGLAEKFDDGKYKADMDALKARYEKAKGEKNFIKQAKEYADIAKDAKKIMDAFKKDKAAAEAALAEAKGAFKKLEEARKRDQAAVMEKMKLPSLDTRSIGRMLAGPMIAERTEQIMKWMAVAKKYMPAGAKGVLKNEAPRGREVHFPKEKTYPTVLIRKLQLTGELGLDQPLDYSGTIEGLTTQPQVYGRPTVAVIKGSKGPRRLDFRGSLDATGDTLRTDSRLAYSGMAIGTMRLGSPSSLSVEINGATGALEASAATEGDKVEGKASFRLSGASFKPSAENIKAPQLRSAVESSFAGLTSALIEADISGTVTKPELAVRTDLADNLSKAFSSAMGAELKKAQDAARAKVDEALKPYKDRLDSLASEKQAELSNKLKASGDRLSAEGEQLLKGSSGGSPLNKIKF